ncbi:MAG: hypothetical protein ACYCV0_02745, partial [Desulfitobacteriaceae bacterium]
MFRRFLKVRSTNTKQTIPTQKTGRAPRSPSSQALPPDFDEAISEIQAALGHSADLYVHRFQAFTGDTNCAFIYLRSFVDLELLNLFVLSPLQ